ncbi:MAG: histidine ammonia-lyase [Planctomycetes bacterium]|nr:histidine ammonia-lyase [Planctomycetota bacterium]MCW8135315.1 histidine ammonia-lyase [Planctomycetota bacterium]
MAKRDALVLDGRSLTLPQVDRFLLGGYHLIDVSTPARKAVKQGRAFVEKLLREHKPVYGVNTGFGKLASVRIPDEQLDQLQLNLIRSHACGVGEPLPLPVVRLAMLLRLNSLVSGNSGVREEVIDAFVALINSPVVPWVPRKGSVGASGDLAPLAHIGLTLLGEGKAYFDGRLTTAAKALKSAGLRPISLKAKEGLALINGTQIIQAIGLTTICGAMRWVKVCDLAAALTLEAMRGSDSPFDARVAAIRPHPGHALVARNMLKLLAGSEIRESHRDNDPRVQDAYSLRCVPQVHGAARDGFDFVKQIFERELNAVTDNPLLFPADGDVISAGNFHGQPLSQALDFLAILLSELASISERRTEQMVNPDLSNLPPFLVQGSGLNSGLMIAQVVAAALASENKVFSHPASVDSIPTSANKEDHVSMGVTAALKAAMVFENLKHILSIELLAARLALDYHKPLKAGRKVEQAADALRKVVKPLKQDRVLHEDFTAVRELVDAGKLDDVLATLE